LLQEKDYIGEATAYDKMLMLECKDLVSWHKSVSAFANTQGGMLSGGHWEAVKRGVEPS